MRRKHYTIAPLDGLMGTRTSGREGLGFRMTRVALRMPPMQGRPRIPREMSRKYRCSVKILAF